MKTKNPILIIITFVLFISLACNTVMGTPETSAPEIEASPVIQTEPPAEVAPTATPAATDGYFTEEFDADPHWDLAVIPDNPDNNQQAKSDPESVTTTFSDSHMIFNIPEEWLSAFYMYTDADYKDVRVDIEFENQGVSSQQVSLVCRSDGGDKSYEVEVGNDGKWVFKVNRRIVNNGASLAIKTGKSINHYTMICVGNEITFLFNGEEPKGSPYIDTQSQSGLSAGNVGFIVTAKRAVPVDVLIDWFQVSEP
jgi:hypothetical protein